MLPGDPILLVAIGNQRIDAGIWRDDTWVEDSFVHLGVAPSSDINELIEALSRLLSFYKAWQVIAKFKHGLRVRVLLSDAWYGCAFVPWNPRALTGKLLLAHAKQTFAGVGIEVDGSDLIRFADSAYRQPSWAVCYSSRLLGALSDFAKGLRAHLESVVPLGVVAGKATAKSHADAKMLAILDDGEISLWTLLGRASVLLSSSSGMAPPSHPVESTLDLLCRRVKLRDPRLSEVKTVHVLDVTGNNHKSFTSSHYLAVGLSSASSLTNVPVSLQLAQLTQNSVFDVDACQRYPRLNIRALVLLSIVFAFAGTIFFLAARAVSSEANVRHQLAVRSTSIAAKPPVQWSKSDLQRIGAVNSAITELNLPVASLLRAIQPPQDIRVGLLGVQFEPARSMDGVQTLKVFAEARTGEEMARYTAYLASRKPLVDAYLISHEVAETVPLKPYRFSVEAKWRE